MNACAHVRVCAHEYAYACGERADVCIRVCVRMYCSCVCMCIVFVRNVPYVRVHVYVCVCKVNNKCSPVCLRMF